MPGWQDAPVAGQGGSAPAWTAAPPASITPTSVERPEAVDRFVSNFASAVNPIPGIKAIATDPQGLRHGIESNIFEPQRQQFIKAGEAAQGKGEFAGMTPMERASEAFGHGAAGALPLVGPAAANAGEQIGEGDIAGGLGSGAGLLSAMAVPDLMNATGRGLSRTAEPVAENALGIRNVDRAPWEKNIGRTVLDNTSGFSPTAVRRSAGDAISNQARMRDAALSSSPNQVSLRPSRAVVDNAITRAAAGNSDTSHLIPIQEQLNEPKPGFQGNTAPTNTPPPGTIGPSGPIRISELQDPMNALAIRQRLGKDFTKFDVARPVSNEAKQLGNNAYMGLTDEIHRAVPASAEPDRIISNLIPARDSAQARQLNAGPAARIIDRFARPTGALIGGIGGYEAGGIPGAIAGTVGPVLMTDPTAQMIAARGLDTAGKVTRHPITGQVIRGAQNIRPNDQPQ
jgi:hypothetical protein